MSGLKHNNIGLEEGRVTIVKPASILKLAVATGIYALLLYALYDEGFPFRRFSAGLAIAFVVFTLIWVWYVARQKTTSTFVEAERRVYRRNMLWTTAVLEFADIDSVTGVDVSEGYGRGTFYKIAMKSDVYGKGHRLTRTYGDTDDELSYMRLAAKPALDKMLAAVGGGENPEAGPATPIVPENPVHYRKSGANYVITYPKRIAGFLLVGAVLLLYGLFNGLGAIATVGAILVGVTFLFVARITLDTEMRVIRVGKAFGMREKRIPFDQFAGVYVVRSTTNGIYTGTTLFLRFEGEQPDVELARVYSTKGLKALERETEAIIHGVLEAMKDDGGPKVV